MVLLLIYSMVICIYKYILYIRTLILIESEKFLSSNFIILSWRYHVKGKRLQLHLNILLFSLTSVFSKFASIQYNRHGLSSPLLYLFLFLMVANCGIYAITWQQVIKKFSLSTAYANKSVYLLWSQIWAVVIFHENLSIQNIIGILVVLFGVWTVQRYE